MHTRDLSKFYQAEDYFGCAVTKRQQHFGDIASAYSCDIDGEPLNNLVIHKACSSKLITDAQAFFALENISFNIIIRTDLLDKNFSLALTQAGFNYSETTVAMELKLLNQPEPNWSNIYQMDTRLDEWVKPLMAFGVDSPESLQAYKSCHEHALSHNKFDIRHFSLFHENIPVCSLTMSVGLDYVRIDDLATLKTHQRRGFAQILLSFANNLAYQLGKQVTYLEASNQGLGLYHKLNFVEIFKNHLFSVPKS